MKKIIVAFMFLFTLFSFTENKKQEISAFLYILPDPPQRSIFWDFNETFTGWIEVQRAGSENGNFKTLFSLYMFGYIQSGVPVPNKGFYRIKILDEVYSNTVKVEF